MRVRVRLDTHTPNQLFDLPGITELCSAHTQTHTQAGTHSRAVESFRMFFFTFFSTERQ